MMPHSVLKALVRAFTALVRATRRVRITSIVPDLVFGMAVEVCPRTDPSDLLGIEAVGLAVHAPGQPVRPVDFNDSLAGPGERPGQRRTERAGAFHPDRLNGAVSAHPGQQRVVAGVGGRELLVAKQAAVIVDAAA